MQKIIIIDCDDVLYQCNQEAVSRLNETHNYSFSIEDITKWGKLDSPLDQRLDFFFDPDFVSGIPLYPGAVEFILQLNHVAQVILATCVPQCCISARKESLRIHFPEIKDIYIGEKKDSLKGDYLLDDGIHNLEKSSCIHPVVFDQPWNKDSRFPRVKNYGEFLELIEEE